MEWSDDEVMATRGRPDDDGSGFDERTGRTADSVLAVLLDGAAGCPVRGGR